MPRRNIPVIASGWRAMHGKVFEYAKGQPGLLQAVTQR
jgi:hypothetical protein